MKNKAKSKTQVKESILPEKVIKQRKQRILEKEDMSFFFKKVFVVILAVGILLTTIYGIEFVEGQNMYPSIKDGDVAVYFRLNQEYQIGDVVAIEKNQSNYLGRIVAREGDLIEITEDGELIINNNVQQEEIYFLTYPDKNGLIFPWKVTKGHVFVLGDFRTGSVDSRAFGEVSLDEIQGKVITVLRRRGI